MIGFTINAKPGILVNLGQKAHDRKECVVWILVKLLSWDILSERKQVYN